MPESSHDGVSSSNSGRMTKSPTKITTIRNSAPPATSIRPDPDFSGVAETGACPAPDGTAFVSGCGFGRGLPQLLQNWFLSGFSASTLNISMKTPEFKAFIRSSYEVIENDSGVLKFFLHSDPKTKIYSSSFTM